MIDTLIAETNAGSVRWMNGLDKFPIPSNLIQDGNLSNYILPLRGYSVEEIEQQQQRRQQQATSNNPKQRKRALV